MTEDMKKAADDARYVQMSWKAGKKTSGRRKVSCPSFSVGRKL